MTHDELVAKAREHAKDFSETGDARVSLDTLPKVSLLEAAVVYFESDAHTGKIEVFLEKQSGKLLSATLIPAKEK